MFFPEDHLYNTGTILKIGINLVEVVKIFRNFVLRIICFKFLSAFRSFKIVSDNLAVSIVVKYLSEFNLFEFTTKFFIFFIPPILFFSFSESCFLRIILLTEMAVNPYNKVEIGKTFFVTLPTGDIKIS